MFWGTKTPFSLIKWAVRKNIPRLTVDYIIKSKIYLRQNIAAPTSDREHLSFNSLNSLISGILRSSHIFPRLIKRWEFLSIKF